MNRYILLLLILLSTGNSQNIEVSFVERVPYYFQKGDRPKGFLYERTDKILRKAGIPATYRSLPAKRILFILETNHEPHISIGWFKKSDREKIGSFTRPIYRNLPQGVLILKKKSQHYAQFTSFKELRNSPLRLGTIDGYSYGDYIDSLIALAPQTVEKAVVTSISNLQKLEAGRVDYIIVDQEEWKAMIADAQLKENDFKLLRFPDIPQGNLRYLWCSFAVPKESISRINSAISTLYPEVK